jgi:Ca2+-binding EF-hand superfamily protein
MIAYFLTALLGFTTAASPPAASGDRDALFLSPMGEPFRGVATRAAGLEAWFVQADKDGNRALTVSEMQGDATRFFATLDETRDGEIDPGDINRYESAIVPEIRMMGAGRSTSNARIAKIPNGGTMGDYQSGRTRSASAVADSGALGRVLKSGPDEGLKGAGWLGLLNIPQPITSADSNFNRGISESEFLKAASTRFVLLDTDRNGSLSLDELQTRLADLPTGRFGD